jgi:hypothetical protein
MNSSSIDERIQMYQQKLREKQEKVERFLKAKDMMQQAM